MGIQSMEALSEKADFMRESLEKSQTITDNMISILGSFDHRLSALETAMRPTQIRTHSMRRAHENIDKTLKSAEQVLDLIDRARQAEAVIKKGPHEDLEGYLEAIALLRKIIKRFTGNKNLKSSIEVISSVTNTLARATMQLDEEFRQLLASYSKPIDPDRLFDCLPQSLRPAASPHDGGGKKQSEQNKSQEPVVYRVPTLVPPKIIPLLHELVQQMFNAGHQHELFKIYSETRSASMEQSLKKLGVEPLGKEDVQKMPWESLEAKIGNWIHFMRIAVKLLFAGEKKVCDQIFEGLESLRDQCFADVCGESVSILLCFGEAIARSKRSPEKLFVLLDMYEIMKEIMPEFNEILGSKHCAEMREAAKNLTKRLAQTAQDTFGDFEEAVEKDATRTAVHDGTVHPLTSYVINYVKFLFDYQSTLKQLFQEFGGGDPEAQLTSVTTRIMTALQNNLDGKSKQYKDPSLTQLFMMNNTHYIVRSVRRSDAKDFLGDDWVQIHRRIVQQYANQYKRLSWSKILSCLSVQGGSGGNSFSGDPSEKVNISRANIKERFKTFNVQFEELHQRQSQWTVPDSELRESLRLAVAEVLLPAYRSFMKRFGPSIKNGKNPSKYIRFTPEDLERMLAEFFEGKTSSEQKR
ncbi:exocyst complex component EXO70A1-like isoform X1 [Apium graveolens]|uniref:exocyst complex component EXO70A1-like isoform X1 n=1 Tax=Apium graveolens TaxID=4045 RepID=UPI003D7B854C